MADVSINAIEDKIWVVESPQDGIVGEAYVFTLTVTHASTITTGDTKVYLNGTELSSTLLTGSTTVSGNRLTSETFTPSIAGRHVLWFKYVNGSQTENKQLLMRIKAVGKEP